MRIEEMTRGDVPDVLQIAIESGLSNWGAAGYTDELSRGDTLILLARLKEKIVGFIALRLIKLGSIDLISEVEILNFAVAGHLFRQGIGTRLLKHVIKVKKPEKIWLEVRKSNKTAVKFYLVNGFKIVGSRKDYYTNPLEDALLMKLETTCG